LNVLDHYDGQIIPLSDITPLTCDEVDDASVRGLDRMWAALVAVYHHRAATEGLTYKKLGDRIGRSRSQVQRWFSSPFNLNAKSFGLLAEGLNADMKIDLKPRRHPLHGENEIHPCEEARTYILIRNTFGGFDEGSILASPSAVTSANIKTTVVEHA